MEVASLQKQLLLLTLLKRRGSVTRRFWYPGLASVFGLKNILINFAATSENEIEIEMWNIILKTFFSETSKLSKPYTGKVETGYHEIVHVTSDSGIKIWWNRWFSWLQKIQGFNLAAGVDKRLMQNMTTHSRFWDTISKWLAEAINMKWPIWLKQLFERISPKIVV